jgi:hypothetical protein
MRPHDMKYIGFKHQRENKQNSDNIILFVDPTSVSELFVDHVDVDYVNVSWSSPENLTFQIFKLTIDPPDSTTPVQIQE